MPSIITRGAGSALGYGFGSSSSIGGLLLKFSGSSAADYGAPGLSVYDSSTEITYLIFGNKPGTYWKTRIVAITKNGTVSWAKEYARPADNLYPVAGLGDNPWGRINTQTSTKLYIPVRIGSSYEGILVVTKSTGALQALHWTNSGSNTSNGGYYMVYDPINNKYYVSANLNASNTLACYDATSLNNNWYYDVSGAGAGGRPEYNIGFFLNPTNGTIYYICRNYYTDGNHVETMITPLSPGGVGSTRRLNKDSSSNFALIYMSFIDNSTDVILYHNDMLYARWNSSITTQTGSVYSIPWYSDFNAVSTNNKLINYVDPGYFSMTDVSTTPPTLVYTKTLMTNGFSYAKNNGGALTSTTAYQTFLENTVGVGYNAYWLSFPISKISGFTGNIGPSTSIQNWAASSITTAAQTWYSYSGGINISGSENTPPAVEDLVATTTTVDWSPSTSLSRF